MIQVAAFSRDDMPMAGELHRVKSHMPPLITSYITFSPASVDSTWMHLLNSRV